MDEHPAPRLVFLGSHARKVSAEGFYSPLVDSGLVAQFQALGEAVHVFQRPEKAEVVEEKDVVHAGEALEIGAFNPFVRIIVVILSVEFELSRFQRDRFLEAGVDAL